MQPGMGGMSEVYLADDDTNIRKMLKFTQDHLVHDDDMKEKLKTEGRVTQSCRECNSIVNVYDHGEASVMLAEGHNPLWNRV
jgi:serine/threonine protein kinase